MHSHRLNVSPKILYAIAISTEVVLFSSSAAAQQHDEHMKVSKKKTKKAAKRRGKVRAQSLSLAHTQRKSVNDLQSYYIYYNMWSILPLNGFTTHTHTRPLSLSHLLRSFSFFFFPRFSHDRSFVRSFRRIIQNRLLIHFHYMQH